MNNERALAVYFAFTFIIFFSCVSNSRNATAWGKEVFAGLFSFLLFLCSSPKAAVVWLMIKGRCPRRFSFCLLFLYSIFSPFLDLFYFFYHRNLEWVFSLMSSAQFEFKAIHQSHIVPLLRSDYIWGPNGCQLAPFFHTYDFISISYIGCCT